MCYGEFMVNLMSKPLMMTAAKQRKHAMSDDVDFDCSADAPELMFCRDQEDALAANVVMSSVEDCPVLDENEDQEVQDLDPTPPAAGTYKILSIRDKCWNAGEIQNFGTIKLTESAVTTDAQEDKLLNDMFAMDSSKVCTSDMKLYYNMDDLTLSLPKGKTRKCLLADLNKNKMKWGPCKNDGKEFDLRPGVTSGEMHLYVSGTDNCLAMNTYKRNYGDLNLKADRQCLIFDGQEVNPELEGLDSDEIKENCQAACMLDDDSKYKKCVRNCVSGVKNTVASYCETRCDGDVCCLEKRMALMWTSGLCCYLDKHFHVV